MKMMINYDINHHHYFTNHAQLIAKNLQMEEKKKLVSQEQKSDEVWQLLRPHLIFSLFQEIAH